MSSYDSLNVAPYLLTSLGFIRNIEFCILNKYCHRKAQKGNLILQLIFASSVYCFYDFSFLEWNVLCPDFNVSCLVRNSRLAVTQLSRINLNVEIHTVVFLHGCLPLSQILLKQKYGDKKMLTKRTFPAINLRLIWPGYVICDGIGNA